MSSSDFDFGIPPQPSAIEPAEGPALNPFDGELDRARSLLQEVRQELAKAFVGQEDLVVQALHAVLAGGHILVESLPGLGKTLFVRALSKVLGLSSRRIQFTPDLMPADITGSHIFNMEKREFEFRAGPVFTQFLLADELNRSPAKTHAALLEAMQEGQVTLDTHSYQLEEPFLVLATQNPIENEGTYNLPEAALDRFLVKVVIDYPQQEEENRILELFLSGGSPDARLDEEVRTLLDASRLLELQALTAKIHVEPAVLNYITDLVRATRQKDALYLGASPRASVALLKLARASALLAGRPFVVPDDVAGSFLPVLRHRVMLSPESEIEGHTTDAVLAEIRQAVSVPQQVDAATVGSV